MRSRPATVVWAGALVALAVLSLGLVHFESGRIARARIAAQPLRPLLLVDLVANREARGGKPLAELETWRAAAAAVGREVEVFAGESLIDVDPDCHAVWVLPAQDRLSDYDWDALDVYLARGGGALLTGGTGLFSEDEREPSVLERLFPGERFAGSASGAKALRVVGRSALVAGFAAGAELALAKRTAGIATSSPGALAWRGADAGSAVLPGRHRGAPVAWLGFSIAQLDDPDDAARIARNALHFAARQPLLDLRPWPDGRPCAVLVDSGIGHDSADELCRADTANPADAAIDGLLRGGCRFAATAVGERVLPEVLARPSGTIVAIPEPRPRRDAQGAALLRELLSGYEQAERMGSVFSLRTEASWRAAEGREALFASVGKELGARRAWFARPDELTDWWLTREQVDARLETVAPDTVRVVFTNRGASQARGVTARIYVPGGSDTPRVEAARLFARRALLRLSVDHSFVELVARPLDPGTEVSYTLRF
ncbi:MAG: hypothetical protein WEF50_14020 [Myxococcota bacterium]